MQLLPFVFTRNVSAFDVLRSALYLVYRQMARENTFVVKLLYDSLHPMRVFTCVLSAESGTPDAPGDPAAWVPWVRGASRRTEY